MPLPAASPKQKTGLPYMAKNNAYYTSFLGKLEDATELLEYLAEFSKYRNWPGIRKRGILDVNASDSDVGEELDEDESDADLTMKIEEKSGSDTDPEVKSDAESDTAFARVFRTGPQIEHTTYIPRWTDPDWRDVRRIKAKDKDFHTKNQTKKKYKRIFMRMDHGPLLVRPALLPKDARKGATTYAKRYGIHPDAPKGRSRMSPIQSATRRIPLHGGTGTVDYGDLEAELKKLGAVKMEELLEKLGSIKPDEADYNKYMALKKMIEIGVEDVEYQRVFFLGLSTDERVRLKIADPENPSLCPDSDLQGALHPMLDPVEHWPVEVDADVTTPSRWITSLYKLEGAKGKYSTHTNDQRVWMALQPVLQAAGRILEVHPIWKVLCDWTNRRLIPEDRLRHKEVKVKKPKTQPTQPAQHDNASSESEDSDASGTQWRPRRRDAWDWPLYIHTEDNQGEKPPLDSQQSLDLFLAETSGDYDVVGAVWDQLVEDVEFQVGFGAMENPGMTKPGSFGTPYGFCCAVGRSAIDDRIYNEKDCYPRIEIAAGAVWPLLTHSFTKAEKGVVAKHVLSTFLHELGHATAQTAQASTMDFFLEKNKVSQRAIDAIKAVREEINPPFITPDDKDFEGGAEEPFFGRNPEAECGYTVEQQIFGGMPTTATAGSAQDAGSVGLAGYWEFNWLPSVAPAIVSWPFGYWPVSHNKPLKENLSNPRPPIETIFTLTNPAEEAKIFQRSFWDAELTRLGPGALSTPHDGKSRPQVKGTSLPPTTVFQRMLSPDVADTVRKALRDLESAGFLMTSRYLLEWLTEICEKDYHEERMTYFSIDHSERAEWLDHVVNPRTERLKKAAVAILCETWCATPQGCERKVGRLAYHLRMFKAPDPYFPPFDDTDSLQYDITLEAAKGYFHHVVKDLSIKAKAVAILQNAQDIVAELRFVHFTSRDAISPKCKTEFELALSDFQTRLQGFVQVLEDTIKEIKNVLAIDPAQRSQHGGGNDDLYHAILNLSTEMSQTLSMVIANAKTALEDFRKIVGSKKHTLIDGKMYASVLMSRTQRRTRLLKASAIREIYKMPHRLQSLVREMVDMFDYVVYKGSQKRYRNSDLLKVIDNTMKRGPLPDFDSDFGQGRFDGPAAAYKNLFDSVNPHSGVPSSIAQNILPAQQQQQQRQQPKQGAPSGSTSTGATAPSPSPKWPYLFVPEKTTRDYIANLFGGTEILKQMENQDHEHPWIYNDGQSVEAKQKHKRRGKRKHEGGHQTDPKRRLIVTNVNV